MSTTLAPPPPLLRVALAWAMLKRLRAGAQPARERDPRPLPDADPERPRPAQAPTRDAFDFRSYEPPPPAAPPTDGLPWFAEFDPEREAIEIEWQAEPGAPTPRLTIVRATGATELRFGGEVVARLAAGLVVTRSDIRLVRAA